MVTILGSIDNMIGGIELNLYEILHLKNEYDVHRSFKHYMANGYKVDEANVDISILVESANQ